MKKSLFIFVPVITLVGFCVSSTFVGFGCAPAPKTEETTVIHQTTIYTTPPRDDNEMIQRIATRLHVARNATEEHHALQDLHDYQADHNLTYRVQTVRMDTNTLVKSGSTQQYRLRVDVSVFKGDQPVYDFSFVPLDNRNLTLLGE